MKAIRTVESNFTFLGPTPEVAACAAPVRLDRHAVFLDTRRGLDHDDRDRHWRHRQLPDAELELRAVRDHRSLDVVEVEDREEAVLLRLDAPGQIGDNLYVNDRAIALEFKCGHCDGELRLPGAAR